VLPSRVNQQFHARSPRKSRLPRALGAKGASRLFHCATTNAFTFCLTSLHHYLLTSSFPYPLPSSVSCNSFVCHSYENCRAVYQQFPFWNSAPHACQPPSTNFSGPVVSSFLSARFAFSVVSALDPLFSFNFRLSTFSFRLPIPYPPLSFHILAHSFALFCIHKKHNHFVLNCFHTLRQKTQPPESAMLNHACPN
jgi:hypothetical protein